MMTEKEEIPDDFGEHTVSPQGNLDLSIPNVHYIWYYSKPISVFYYTVHNQFVEKTSQILQCKRSRTPSYCTGSRSYRLKLAKGEEKMFQRRIFLHMSFLLVLILLLAACGQAATPAPQAPAEKEEAAQPAEDTTMEEAPAGGATGKLEVFSWWTSGGEAAALDALFAAYNKANPDVEIVNATVAGGGGSAARGVLQTRLAGGDPPDTWQVHPGFELLGQYVEPEFVAPITDLYQEEGWFDVMPSALIDLMSKDAHGSGRCRGAGTRWGLRR